MNKKLIVLLEYYWQQSLLTFPPHKSDTLSDTADVLQHRPCVQPRGFNFGFCKPPTVANEPLPLSCKETYIRSQFLLRSK